VVPLIFDVQGEIYYRNGVDFNALSHLDSLGLIIFSGIAGYRYLKLPKKVRVFYYGKPIDLVLPKEGDNSLNVGKVLLSRAGQEIAPICAEGPVDGFFEYVWDRWSKQKLISQSGVDNETPDSSTTANAMLSGDGVTKVLGTGL
jgi:hypothetical protein